MNKQEKLDAFTEIEMMMEDDRYSLREAINHISKAYDINSFQLGLFYATYRKTGNVSN